MNGKVTKNIAKIILIGIVIGGGLIPFFINVLYKNYFGELIRASWTSADALIYAGSVLTFIGTVVLGYVSYEQAKNANLMAEKSEKIAKEANELNIAARIIEYETSNYNELIKYFDEYVRLCSPQYLLTKEFNFAYYDAGNINQQGIFDMIAYRDNVISVFSNLGRVLYQDKDFEKYEDGKLNELYKNCYEFTVKFIDFHLNEQCVLNSTEYDQCKILEYRNNDYENLIIIGEKYIISRNKYIKSLLFEEVSLEELRKQF